VFVLSAPAKAGITLVSPKITMAAKVVRIATSLRNERGAHFEDSGSRKLLEQLAALPPNVISSTTFRLNSRSRNAAGQMDRSARQPSGPARSRLFLQKQVLGAPA
jgi:hypothetical protein